MKQLLSSILLTFLVLGQFQVGNVYAQSQGALSQEKQKQIQVLDQVGDIIDTTFEKLDDKTKNTDIKEKIAEKKKESEEYIQEVQKQIESENSTKEMKEIVQEAKKVVILKVVAGVTEDQEIEDKLPEEVQKNANKKKQALEVIQDSLETKTGDYSLIVKTEYSQNKVEELFHKFDSSIKVDFLYEQDAKNYFEVFFSEESIFRQEMLSDIASGTLPENFLGIDIVLPEVFTISTFPTGEGETSSLLGGENLDVTWSIRQYQSYNYTKSGNNNPIKVAIIDTGIESSHPDLKGRVLAGYDFVSDDNDPADDQGHGTHVAGTIGASLNGSGIIGVNHRVQFVPLKICNAQGFCPSYGVIRALDWVQTNNIDVVNMSLGGRGTVAGNPICDGIQAVVDAGSIVVAASGNSNVDTSTFVPGGCPASITVAAYDSSLKRASFSNYGNKIDVAAPGVGVYSTYPSSKGSYKQLSGTSMATPHIVGLVSLMLEQDSSLRSTNIKELFKKYPLSVSTDVGKYIASGVNVSEMMSYLQTREEDGEVKEEVIREIQEESENTERQDNIQKSQIQDDAELDETLTLQENSGDVEINSTSEIIFPDYIPKDFSLVLDAGTVEINSQQEISGDEEKVSLGTVSNENEGETDSHGDQNFESLVQRDWEIPESSPYSYSGAIELFPSFLRDTIEINSFEEETREIQIEEETLFFPSIENMNFDIDLGGEKSENVEINNIEPSVFELSEETQKDQESLEKIYLGEIGDISDEDILDTPDQLQEMHVEVKESPEQSQDTEDIGIQSTYSCIVMEGQYCEYRINNAHTFTYTNTVGGLVNISAGNRYLTLYPIAGKSGTTTINVWSGQWLFYTINVEVKAKPKPIEISTTVSVGQAINLLVESGSYYSYSTTNTSLLSATRYGIGSVQLYGNYVGSADVYVRDNSGNIKYIIHVTIVPRVTNTTLTAGYTFSLSYNRPDRYSYSSSNPSLVRISANSSYLNITGISGGNVTVYAKYNNVVQYVINLTITEPPIIQDTLYQGQTLQSSLGTNSADYRVENLNPSLLSASLSGNIGTFTAYNTGTAKIKIFQRNVNGYTSPERWIASIVMTIQPRPAIIYTSCTLELSGNCTFTLQSPERYTYSSTSNIVSINYSTASQYFKIQAEQYGVTKVYVKYGTNTLYVIDVKVPPKVYTCEVPVGIRCKISRVTTSNNGGATPQTAGIVSVSTGWAGTTITGVKQGYTDVFVYEYGVHIATIKTTILPPPLPLQLAQTSISVMEQERKTVTILSGNGNYKVREHIEPGKERVHAGVSSDGKSISIKGNTLEKNYDEGTLLIVTDKWGQEAQIQVIVRKSRVILDTSSLVPLELGGEILIPITEYNHSANLKLARNNRNILLYKVYGPDGYMSGIRLYGNYSGTTIISVTDSFGAEYSFSASVKGESFDPDLDNDPNDVASVRNVVYTDTLGTEDIGGVYFEVTGYPKEVGVEFTNTQGILERQKLEIQPDGIYIVAFSQEFCGRCNDFRPYYRDDTSPTPYYAQQKTYGVNYISGTTAIASVENVEGVEINSTTDIKTTLYSLLKRTDVKSYVTTLSQTTKKLVSIKTKYQDPLLSNIISFIPIVGEGYDIATLVLGVDPITGESLGNFQKTLTLAGLIGGATSGAGARTAGDLALKGLAKELGMTEAEIYKIAGDVASTLKVNSLQDLINLKDKLQLSAFIKTVKLKAALIRITQFPGRVSKPDLSKISNVNLKSVLETDYRNTATIGNGSTADAIRYELLTNEPVGGAWHKQKGQDILNGIQKRFNANDLNEYDKNIATSIFNDITNAINGK